jgi:hypothetical protein
MRSCWLSIVGILWLAPLGSGQEADLPLRFVPSQAEWVVQFDRPRDLVDAVEKNEIFQQALQLAGVRELYDTTNVQQLYQLLVHFEKKLGRSRNELIDELGAGGIVIAAKLTPPSGAVLIVQAKDGKAMRRFADLALEVLASELERQESKDKIVRKKYEGIDVGQIGPKLSFALADKALIVATESKVLKAALDTNIKKDGHANILQVSSFQAARKKSPPNALAWTWLNFESFRKHQPFQDGLNAASLDPLQQVLFGGFTDLFKRTPYLTASLLREGSDYRLAAYVPRGREGMAAIKHLMLPVKSADSLPVLHTPRTLASSSFYLDLGQFWDKRVDILGEKNAKGLDDGEQNIAKILGGLKLGKVFNAMGPNARVVVAQQKEQPYKLKPATPIPAFALVTDMRDPTFAKDMNSLFRAGALLATFQVGLRLHEETHQECEIITYFFSETKKVEGDAGNVRFNFSPSYVTVGDYFVMSSTLELARDLIDALKSEQRRTRSKATMHTQFYASGLADVIRANEDATLTQLILAQALPPKTAKAELHTILRWIETLGTLRIESHYGTNEFRYDVIWQAKKR